MGNEHGKAGTSMTPAGIQSMDETLQRKFAKGIQFNMKILLKGDRNTGKTCLFHRMGGKGFQEAYLPTSEIQVNSILWSYKVTNDTVKVEVWDIVDKGKVQKRESKGGLKLFNTTPDVEEEEGGKEGKVLDASFLDVYKGCHGVVLMFDMTKIWTWKYVEREFPKVPYDIPVMILANFRDMGDHRAITKDEVLAFIESVKRPDGSSEVVYAESSMKNAFGLMHLHKFLSIPFLQLQQDMLLQQIKVSREQMMAARDELATAANTEDQNYDMFSARLQRTVEEKRRKSQLQQEAQENGDPSPGTVRRHTMDSDSISSTSSAQPHAQTTPSTNTPPTSHIAEQQDSSKKKGFKRLSNFLSKNKEKYPEPSKGTIPVHPQGSGRGVVDESTVDDFVPEGDTGFLDDDEVDGEVEEGEEEGDSEESSSEDDATPAIARDEDLSTEEDDQPPPKPPSPEPSPVVKHEKPVRPAVQLKSAKEIELTESEPEEEAEEEQTVPRSVTTNKQKDMEFFWGGEDKLKSKGKSGGLLLDWTKLEPKPEPEPTKPSKKKKESPDFSEERSERRKKKSKKSSKRRENEAAAGSNGGTPTAATNDPFASLDAWLNSDDTGILQPKSVAQGRGAEVGEEEEEEGSRRRSKKHHHRDRRASDGSRKKKHKSRHSTRDKDGDQT